MSDLYGYNFSPDLANKFRSSLNNPTGASQLGPEVGQALRVISLHLPAFTGGSPIAPDSLLRPSHSFTPDAAVRAQTTGTPPSPAPPISAGPSAGGMTPGPSIGTGPITTQPQPRIGSGSSDSGPQIQSAAVPGLPTITFGDGPGNGSGVAAPPPSAPSPTPPMGGGVGGGMDTQNPLNSLLDAFLRGSRGV